MTNFTPFQTYTEPLELLPFRAWQRLRLAPYDRGSASNRASAGLASGISPDSHRGLVEAFAKALKCRSSRDSKALRSFTTLLLLTGLAQAAGIDQPHLAQITERMNAFVASGSIAGAVTLVEHQGKIVHLAATGYADLASKTKMDTGTIFEIMSMTKPFTGVAIMMLAEEGRLSISDPLEKHLPEFRGIQLEENGRLKAPTRKITLHDLMTHTSGLPEYGPPALADIYTKFNHTLAEVTLLNSQLTLKFEPGAKWQYSNPGLAALGRVIEVISGQPYEQFLAQRIFAPLGMKDSFFFPKPEQYPRIAHVYGTAGGKLTGYGDAIYRKGGKYAMPEGGMYSTATDLAAFYRMVLNGGVYNGKRLLSKASVDTMTKLHTGAIDPAGHSPGMGYGLTWTVGKDARSTTALLDQATFGHGGAFGTDAFVDPKKDLIGILLIQRVPGAGSEQRVFREIAASAVRE